MHGKGKRLPGDAQEGTQKSVGYLDDTNVEEEGVRKKCINLI